MRTGILALILVGAVSACNSVPDSLIITPSANANQAWSSQQLNLNFQDLRAHRHIVTVSKGADQNDFIPSHLPLKERLLPALRDALQQSGAQISPMAAQHFELVVVALETVVKQQTLDYEAQTSIVLEAKLSKPTPGGKSRLNKTFTRTISSYGKLKADPAVLEREINQGLSLTLSDMLADPELNGFF